MIYPENKNIFSLPYAIPDEYVVKNIPYKEKIFSNLRPQHDPIKNYTYKENEEKEYYENYQKSRFAFTQKKGGWDCLRHYEILASGCVPIFENLEKCPNQTMKFFPKNIVIEANKRLIPWENKKKELYDFYASQLIEYCKNYCSVSFLTEYFLSHFENPKKILMFLCDYKINYSREILSIGLRRKFKENFIEYPKNEMLYVDHKIKNLYGNGFTYSAKFKKDDCDRMDIEKRIKQNEFDIIIFGKVGPREGIVGSIEEMPFINCVLSNYSNKKIVFIYGGDDCYNIKNKQNKYTKHLLKHKNLGMCFVRELSYQ